MLVVCGNGEKGGGIKETKRQAILEEKNLQEGGIGTEKATQEGSRSFQK